MCVPLCRRSYETDGGDIYQIKPILRAGLTSGGGKGAWVERVCVPSVRSLYHPHTRSSSYAFWTGREPHACAWLRHRARRSTARASTCRSEASRAVVRVVRFLPTSDHGRDAREPPRNSGPNTDYRLGGELRGSRSRSMHTHTVCILSGQ